MKLTINGETFELTEEITVGAFLAGRELKPQMIVVERNGQILRREEYDTTPLAHGDVLEIVQMMAGG